MPGQGPRCSGKPQALAVGTPEVVSLEDGFGYRLNGSNGIQIPWLALPVEGGNLKPFTVSIDLTLEDIAAGGAVVTAAAADNGPSLAIFVDPDQHVPQARLSAGGGGASRSPGRDRPCRRTSATFSPSASFPRGAPSPPSGSLTACRFPREVTRFSLPGIPQGGTTLIGGEKGFKGIVDEFGVYYRDPAGKPSTDPDQFLRAQTMKLGASLVMANGFDGMFLSEGFTVEGNGQQAAGALTLRRGPFSICPC